MMCQARATTASATLGWPHHPSAGKLPGKFAPFDALIWPPWNCLLTKFEMVSNLFPLSGKPWPPSALLQPDGRPLAGREGGHPHPHHCLPHSGGMWHLYLLLLVNFWCKDIKMEACLALGCAQNCSEQCWMEIIWWHIWWHSTSMTHSTHIITVSLTLIDLEVIFICQVVYTLYCVMVENRKGGGWHFSHYRKQRKWPCVGFRWCW